MKINNIEVTAKEFAYNGCHKFYILEDEKDKQEAKSDGYMISPIDLITIYYITSCPLRYINNWKLTKTYVKQCATVMFEDKNSFVMVKYKK